jgi:hypothetical protein
MILKVCVVRASCQGHHYSEAIDLDPPENGASIGFLRGRACHCLRAFRPDVLRLLRCRVQCFVVSCGWGAINLS